MKKALPPLLLCFALAAAWYYWQQRPMPPLTAPLLPFEAADMEQINIQLPNLAAFSLKVTPQNWVAEQGSRSLVVRSQKPQQLLQRLLSLQSQGLAKQLPVAKEEVARIDLIGENLRQELIFFEVLDSGHIHTFLQINQLPDVYRLPNFQLSQLPLLFADYEDLRLLDLSAWPSLDSLLWLQDSSRQRLLGLPEHAQQLDSLHQAWFQLAGRVFATDFDEVGHQDRYFGTYRLFSQQDSIDLLLYHDIGWPDTLVVSSSQFPKHFFWLKDRWF